MNKLVIITTDEKVKIADYKDYTDIQNAVGGFFEHFYTERSPILAKYVIGKNQRIDFWCNEEGLLRDDIMKVNAVATTLYNSKSASYYAPIYGNVCILLTDSYGESHGFEYKETKNGNETVEDICQCFCIEDFYMRLISNNQPLFECLHKTFDKHFPKAYEQYVAEWYRDHADGYDACDSMPACYEEWLHNEKEER